MKYFFDVFVVGAIHDLSPATMGRRGTDVELRALWGEGCQTES